jgi:hypothetical protein
MCAALGRNKLKEKLSNTRKTDEEEKYLVLNCVFSSQKD